MVQENVSDHSVPIDTSKVLIRLHERQPFSLYLFLTLIMLLQLAFSLYLTRQWQSKHISTKCAISMGIESALVNLKFSFLLIIWYFISHMDLKCRTCWWSWEQAYRDQNASLIIRECPVTGENTVKTFTSFCSFKWPLWKWVFLKFHDLYFEGLV